MTDAVPLPQLPRHWDAVEMKWLLRFNNGRDYKEVESEEGEYPVFGSGGAFALATEYLHDGESVLFGRKGTIDRPLHVNERFWTVDTMYYTTIGPSLFGRFLYYYATTIPYGLLSTSTALPSMTQSALGTVKVPLPPLEEQRDIANFLDRETAQIDAMIDAQQRLVSVLSERRTAMITHVVTRGLHTDVDLIASDLPWIGQAPSHWSILRLGNVGRSTIGLTYDPADITDDPERGSLVLRAGNIQGGQISLDDSVYVTTPIPSNLRTRVGDILICARNGSAHLIGKNAVITPEVSGETWGAFMTVYRSEANPFIRWVLNSAIFSHQMGSFSTSTVNQLTSRTLHGMRIPMPPPDEQRQIVDYLDSSAAHFDRLVSEAQRSIALLRERRAAVITAAVTGRLDPRTGVERVDEIMEGAVL